MKKAIAFLLALVCLPALALENDKEVHRVRDAGLVLKEILNIPDDIPKDLLNRAECVIIMPSVKKLAIGFGGDYGRGVMVCRSGEHFTGPWGAPAMYALEGGNFGFQLGAQATDFVFLVMNTRGAESLMSTKLKLGADAAAAAGPKGRDTAAATDLSMRAEILSYSRSRGLFAGVSLEGSTLRPDGGANEKLYGHRLTAKEILREGKTPIPSVAHRLDAELQKASPKNLSDPKSLE